MGCGVRGVGCGAWDVGCGVWGVWCGVWDVGCGVEGWDTEVKKEASGAVQGYLARKR